MKAALNKIADMCESWLQDLWVGLKAADKHHCTGDFWKILPILGHNQRQTLLKLLSPYMLMCLGRFYIYRWSWRRQPCIFLAACSCLVIYTCDQMRLVSEGWTRRKVQTFDQCVSVFFPYFSIFAGIACIGLSFVDAHGRPLQGPAQDEVQRWEMGSSPFHPQLFDELTTVSKVNSINGSSAPGNHKRVIGSW